MRKKIDRKVFKQQRRKQLNFSFQLERVIVKGLLGLEGELKGDYSPLHGSRSYAPKPTGMTKEKEEELRNNGNLFQVCDTEFFVLLTLSRNQSWEIQK